MRQAAAQEPLPPVEGSLVGFYRILSSDEQLELSQLDLRLADVYFAIPGSVALLISSSGSSARVFQKSEDGFGSDVLSFPESATTFQSPEAAAHGLRTRHTLSAAPATHTSDHHGPVVPPPSFSMARAETTDTVGEDQIKGESKSTNDSIAENRAREDQFEFRYNEFGFEPAEEESLDSSRRRLDPRIAAGIAVAVLIALAVWLLPSGNQSDRVTSQGESSIGLEVQRSAGGLMLKWNPASPEISSASVGLVTIQDGANQQELPLDRDQLMTGRLFYPPLSDVVRFTIQIFGEKGVQRDYAAAIVPANAGLPAPTPLETPTSIPPRPVEPRPRPSAVSAADRATGAPDAAVPKSRVVERTAARPLELPLLPQSMPLNLVEPPPSADQPGALTTQRSEITGAPATIERMTSFRQLEAPPAPAEPRTPPPSAVPRAADALPESKAPAVSRTYVPPRPIRQTKPVLPRNLHALVSREMLVEVNLTIDADGSILRAEASPGEGALHEPLARLAVATARLWKFRPAREGTRNVPGEIQIQFQFSPGP